MIPAKDTRIFRFTLFFAAAVLFFNLLIAVLYFPITYLQATGNAFLVPIYYIERLIDLLFSVFTIAAVLTVLRLRHGVYAIIIHVIPIIGNFIYQGIYLIFNLWQYELRDALISQAINFGIFLILHLALTLVLHFCFLRGNEDEPAGKLAFSNSLCLSNLITTLIFFVAGLVTRIIETVTFVNEELYGMISFATPAEILMIVWEYVFLVLSAVLAFFVMLWTEKYTDRYLKREA